MAKSVLEIRITKAAEAAGIDSLEKLSQKSDEEILLIPGISRKSLGFIREHYSFGNPRFKLFKKFIMLEREAALRGDPALSDQELLRWFNQLQ